MCLAVAQNRSWKRIFDRCQNAPNYGESCEIETTFLDDQTLKMSDRLFTVQTTVSVLRKHDGRWPKYHKTVSELGNTSRDTEVWHWPSILDVSYCFTHKGFNSVCSLCIHITVTVTTKCVVFVEVWSAKTTSWKEKTWKKVYNAWKTVSEHRVGAL